MVEMTSQTRDKIATAIPWVMLFCSLGFASVYHAPITYEVSEPPDYAEIRELAQENRETARINREMIIEMRDVMVEERELLKANHEMLLEALGRRD